MSTSSAIENEALALLWQQQLGLHGSADASSEPVVTWADGWIVRLNTLPDALAELSLDTRTLADTGYALRRLSDLADWRDTIGVFAAWTLPMLEERPEGYFRYFTRFDAIVRDERFPPDARREFNAALDVMVQHLDETLDAPLFKGLLKDWINFGSNDSS